MGYKATQYVVISFTTSQTGSRVRKNLVHLSIYWSLARHLKGLAFSGIHSNS